MSERSTVVIAGGGPAGMVVGLLLARAGIEVTVLEKHADFLRDFRGDTVHPSTLTLLDELGLGEEFAARTHTKIAKVSFPTDDGTMVAIADMSRLNVPHPYVAMVPQWEFLDIIADAGRLEPTFTLRMNSEVTGLLRDDSGVHGVRYRDRSTDTELELESDLVIAADGRWSIARHEACLPSIEYPMDVDAWWFRLPRRDGDPVSLSPTVGRGEFGVCIPREGYFQLALIAPKGSDAAMRDAGLERFRERAAQLWSWTSDRVDTLESMDDVKHLDIRVNRLKRWYADGLLCIGDAAHAMSPVGGVGVNLAVQDAVAAATLLADPLRMGRVSTRELAGVQRRRLLPTLAVQGLQRLLHAQFVGPVIRGERTAPPAGLVRLLRRFPWLSYLPARLIGLGVRPEHAPAFARR